MSAFSRETEERRLVGAYMEVTILMRRVRALRQTAQEWMQRARNIAPVLLCLVSLITGCANSTQEFSASFDVSTSDNGQSVLWSLHFSREDYHRFLNSTPNGDEKATLRELISAGLKSHELSCCQPQESAVTKLRNGEIAFVGKCAVAAHAVPAGI